MRAPLLVDGMPLAADALVVDDDGADEVVGALAERIAILRLRITHAVGVTELTDRREPGAPTFGDDRIRKIKSTETQGQDKQNTEAATKKKPDTRARS